MACLETEEESKKEQKGPQTKNYHWTKRRVNSAGTDCRGINAQGFFVLGPSLTETHGPDCYFTVPFNYFF